MTRNGAAVTAKPELLFVEDEAPLREHLATQLSSEYQVTTAADGEQALRAILRKRPDVIVTDLVMPGLDGVELVKTLRRTPSTATIPVLMLSGRAPDELRLEGFEVGADAFLAKPYTERELRIRIRALLTAARMRTAEAQREARARADEEILRDRAALLESISDAFYAVDRDWRVTYVNQRALDYFDKPREQLVGMNIWDMFPIGKGTRVEEEYRRAMQTRQSVAFEFISPLTERWIDVNVYPTPQGIAVNFRDITDRKHAEIALRELTTTLEQRVEAAVTARNEAAAQLAHSQKMETIGQLTGGVAHDFNNLLTPIVGALDLLRRKYATDDRSDRLISGALQAAERARTLVQRLLAFARKQHLEAQAVDIKTLMVELSDLLARTLGPRIEITTHVHERLPSALVDPNQLELAILNLALNARDAMPGGGTLTLSAKPVTVEREESLAPGEYVSISVADTGAGMDAETLARAIEPFFTTKAPGQGTGLGLSMVHGLAAQSGGDLTLTSIVGQGTVATLRLPMANGVSQAQVPPEQVEMGGAALTVLLVDDDDLVRSSTAAMLNEGGYQVVEARSAQEGLSLIEQGLQVHVVLTDYAMPGMTGVQLAQTLRSILPAVPLLMITGFADLSEEAADGLPRLAKPYRQNELIACVAELTRGVSVTGDGVMG